MCLAQWRVKFSLANNFSVERCGVCTGSTELAQPFPVVQQQCHTERKVECAHRSLSYGYDHGSQITEAHTCAHPSPPPTAFVLSVIV